jgi:UDP:flavonoid glycosyltransferase YjiC (YdhE family)
MASKPKFLKAVATHRWLWWEVEVGSPDARNATSEAAARTASRCLPRMPRLSKQLLRTVRETAARVARVLRTTSSTLARLLLIEYVEQILVLKLPAGRAGVVEFLTSCF